MLEGTTLCVKCQAVFVGRFGDGSNVSFSRDAPGAALALAFFTFPLRDLRAASDVTGAQSAASNVMERCGVYSRAAEATAPETADFRLAQRQAAERHRAQFKTHGARSRERSQEAAGCSAAERPRDAIGLLNPTTPATSPFSNLLKHATA